jgi:hypothetical protein
VQYRLYDDDTFEFYAIEIDDEPYDYATYFELIVRAYGVAPVRCASSQVRESMLI